MATEHTGRKEAQRPGSQAAYEYDPAVSACSPQLLELIGGLVAAHDVDGLGAPPLCQRDQLLPQHAALACRVSAASMPVCQSVPLQHRRLSAIYAGRPCWACCTTVLQDACQHSPSASTLGCCLDNAQSVVLELEQDVSSSFQTLSPRSTHLALV